MKLTHFGDRKKIFASYSKMVYTIGDPVVITQNVHFPHRVVFRYIQLILTLTLYMVSPDWCKPEVTPTPLATVTG